MSANLELIRSMLPDEIDLVDVVNSDSPTTMFSSDVSGHVAPDVEVKFVATQTGGPGRAFDGIAGLVEGWRDWLLPYHSYRIAPEEFFDAGRHVVMHVRVSARTERDGVQIEHRPSSVWTVEDGQIVAVRFFLERDEALRFAGLA